MSTAWGAPGPPGLEAQTGLLATPSLEGVTWSLTQAQGGHLTGSHRSDTATPCHSLPFIPHTGSPLLGARSPQNTRQDGGSAVREPPVWWGRNCRAGSDKEVRGFRCSQAKCQLWGGRGVPGDEVEVVSAVGFEPRTGLARQTVGQTGEERA